MGVGLGLGACRQLCSVCSELWKVLKCLNFVGTGFEAGLRHFVPYWWVLRENMVLCFPLLETRS